MSPAEEARTFVEAWCLARRRSADQADVCDLVERLTPVFARAAAVARLRDALRLLRAHHCGGEGQGPAHRSHESVLEQVDAVLAETSDRSPEAGR